MMRIDMGKMRGAVVAGALLAATAWAGPVWDENSIGNSDAGSKTEDAQVTDGTGPLLGVEGMLEGVGSAGRLTGVTIDFEDMYVIRVCRPVDFKASTVFVDGGGADFDTQLWLFRPGMVDPTLGFGLLGNDNTTGPPSLLSRLLPVPTDGSPPLTEPGLYYLAVTGSDNDPESAIGPIFDQLSSFEISGPDGDGGAFPIETWSQADPLEFGTYLIALRGVTFATETTIDCNDNGRHDMCDIAFGGSSDGNANQVPDECEADLDGDGDVDVADLLMLLGDWGPCGGCPGDFDGDGMVGVADLLFLLGQWSA